MTKLYNSSKTKLVRRILRKTQTEHERILWSQLRDRRFLGLKFYRQYGVDRFVIDFYCPQIKLAIELDGSQHGESEHITYDQERAQYLQLLGINVVRFWDNDVKKNLPAVMEVISGSIQK